MNAQAVDNPLSVHDVANAPSIQQPLLSEQLLPEAPSVNLDEPVLEPTLLKPSAPNMDESMRPMEPQGSPLILLSTKVPPATATRLAWSPRQSLEGIAMPSPVLVVNGAKHGPVLCLTAALHGDELNGIEIVRRVLYNIDPQQLTGAVIGVPIVNLQGFHRSSRYLTDRRDLNRYFPGNPTGSSAGRIAYSFFNDVISHCDALVDLHTGSFHRTNLPQLRADLDNPGALLLAQGFGATVILHSEGSTGTLRRAAVDAGIPAVTLEAGGPMKLQESAVKHGVKGVRSLLNQMGMLRKISLWSGSESVYHQSMWVRADQGGILFSAVDLGDNVDKGEVLGTVTDPITNIRSEVVAPVKGRVIGMAFNQVVMPGFAAFHLGIDTQLNKDSEDDKVAVDNDSADLESVD